MSEEIENIPKKLPKEKTELESLKAAVEEKNQLLEEEKHKLLRALADFDNYRAKMVPYDRKIDEGGMLSDEEVKYLKNIRMEL